MCIVTRQQTCLCLMMLCVQMDSPNKEMRAAMIVEEPAYDKVREATAYCENMSVYGCACKPNAGCTKPMCYIFSFLFGSASELIDFTRASEMRNLVESRNPATGRENLMFDVFEAYLKVHGLFDTENDVRELLTAWKALFTAVKVHLVYEQGKLCILSGLGLCHSSVDTSSPMNIIFTHIDAAILVVKHVYNTLENPRWMDKAEQRLSFQLGAEMMGLTSKQGDLLFGVTANLAAEINVSLCFAKRSIQNMDTFGQGMIFWPVTFEDEDDEGDDEDEDEYTKAEEPAKRTKISIATFKKKKKSLETKFPRFPRLDQPLKLSKRSAFHPVKPMKVGKAPKAKAKGKSTYHEGWSNGGFRTEPLSPTSFFKEALGDAIDKELLPIRTQMVKELERDWFPSKELDVYTEEDQIVWLPPAIAALLPSYTQADLLKVSKFDINKLKAIYPQHFDCVCKKGGKRNMDGGVIPIIKAIYAEDGAKVLGFCNCGPFTIACEQM